MDKTWPVKPGRLNTAQQKSARLRGPSVQCPGYWGPCRVAEVCHQRTSVGLQFSVQSQSNQPSNHAEGREPWLAKTTLEPVEDAGTRGSSTSCQRPDSAVTDREHSQLSTGYTGNQLLCLPLGTVTLSYLQAWARPESVDFPWGLGWGEWAKTPGGARQYQIQDK